MTTSIHKPVVQVKLADGMVLVSELSWPDARYLYDKLVGQSKILAGPNGELVLSAEKITTAITDNIDLGTWLVLQSTGQTEEWLAKRSLSEVLDIATEAALLNIGVIVGRLKNARSRLQTMVAGQPEPTSTDSLPTSPST